MLSASRAFRKFPLQFSSRASASAERRVAQRSRHRAVITTMPVEYRRGWAKGECTASPQPSHLPMPRSFGPSNRGLPSLPSCSPQSRHDCVRLKGSTVRSGPPQRRIFPLSATWCLGYRDCFASCAVRGSSPSVPETLQDICHSCWRALSPPRQHTVLSNMAAYGGARRPPPCLPKRRGGDLKGAAVSMS